jgi:hypothetical protein
VTVITGAESDEAILVSENARGRMATLLGQERTEASGEQKKEKCLWRI